ncbi:hypothetical protein [Pseudonocardia endophytica]|uniref:Uncharacterized protein n=1 Tax=Pseudonocardia endophytica TaxID=401976 RepID=A0A4R1IAW1_PSEEN|nr:hypothetical protein [Pseudonocardia endophytica]TCK27522.1 hypothetical protein EV378_3394 [Pseudonocardia endophytica]
MTTDSDRRRWCPGDAVLSGVVDTATRKLAEQTEEAFRTRTAAACIAKWNVLDQQRAGHLLELWHKHSFNIDAIGKGASIRAVRTACVGEHAAAADIRLVDGDRIEAEIQAKLYGRATETARALAQPKYAGMQRLVAEDKLADVDSVLDKALGRDADGIYQADYTDTAAHLTDTVTHGDVRSSPVSSGEMIDAAKDAKGWGNRLASGAAARQIGSAALGGAALGGALSGAVETVAQVAKVRAGETSAAAAAATAAGAAARGAARSGTLASLGTAAKVAMTAGGVPKAVTGGGLPCAVASAVFGVAEAGIALARGEVDAAEFAARSGESTFQAGLAWAGGAIGQTVLPVPVLGALVGGFVGQVAATLIVQGLQYALSAAIGEGADEERITLLEAETRAAIDTAAVLGEAERVLGDAYDVCIARTAVPAVDDVLLTTLRDGPDQGLLVLTDLGRRVYGVPLFLTAEEFDDWMTDPLTSLTLDPNR